MHALTEDQLDTLREVVNVGVGRAAAALYTLIGDEVALAVPDVEFLSRQEAILRIHSLVSGDLSGVRQSMRGHLTGDALLLFSMNNSLELAKLMLHRDIDESEFEDMVAEVFSEMGNIIINAGLGAIVNMLELELNIGLPEYQYGGIDEIMTRSQSANYSNSNIMLLRVRFSLRSHEIDGYIMFLLDLAGQMNLFTRVEKLLNRYANDS